MAKTCLILTAKTLAHNLTILNKYRQHTDIAELRVDCLDPNERFMIRRFPEQAGLPVILTIRREADCGHYDSGEGSRINLMAKGLAYADADRRRNFAYLDIEEDLSVPSLEEAARTFGTRIIRSYHNFAGIETDLEKKICSMRHSADDIVKIAIMANSTWDVLKLLRAGKKCPDQEKILVAMGHFGIYSRILCEQFGSLLSYAGTLSEPGTHPPAPGLLDIMDLTQLYRYGSIKNTTKVYGVTGYPLTVTNSPWFFNTIFALEGINGVYVPFPVDSINACMELMQELKVEGLSVTVPYKESVVPFLSNHTAEVRSIGACNTLNLDPRGWQGANTDARGFSDSLLKFTGRPHLKRQRVTIIGAGGSARAVAFELHRLGARALILNRTVYKARDLAAPYKFAWGGLDSLGIEQMGKYKDIIIQTTPAGMEGNDISDPVKLYNFTGREEVMDIIYKPEMTPFLKRAAAAGCRVQNGDDMFIRQACYQYTRFTGKEFPEHLMARFTSGI